MTHLITKFILSLIIREVLEAVHGEPRVSLGWTEYLKRVAPPGESWYHRDKSLKMFAFDVAVWPVLVALFFYMHTFQLTNLVRACEIFQVRFVLQE